MTQIPGEAPRSWCGFPGWWTSLRNFKHKVQYPLGLYSSGIPGGMLKLCKNLRVYFRKEFVVSDVDNYEVAFLPCECPVACSKLCGEGSLWVVVGTAGLSAFQVPTNKCSCSAPHPLWCWHRAPTLPHFQGRPHWELLVWRTTQEGDQRSAFRVRFLSACVTLTLAASGSPL